MRARLLSGIIPNGAAMPADKIYSVDFANGNLTPSVDKLSWGQMHLGQSAPQTGHTFNSDADSEGRGLRISRASGSGPFISNSVYVIPSSLQPPTSSLAAPTSSAYAGAVGELLGGHPLGTRLILRVEFDSPHASPFPHPEKIDPLKPEAWAVVLKLKISRSPNDAQPDAVVAVTCQFNNKDNPNGVEGARLNTPGAQQGGRVEPLDTPLDYAKYHGPSPTLFVLEHAFCGIQAGLAPVPATTTPNAPIGHSAGCGFLDIGGKKDLRVFSSTGLSKIATASIGALGVAVITLTGVGKISVRLRRFSVAIWP